MSVIDDTLRIAREVHPDLWARTEAVARIIAPETFEDTWTIVEPESARKLHDARLKVLQSNAMSKAQAVLTYLGVNTDTDWFEILTRLAAQGTGGPPVEQTKHADTRAGRAESHPTVPATAPTNEEI